MVCRPDTGSLHSGDGKGGLAFTSQVTFVLPNGTPARLDIGPGAASGGFRREDLPGLGPARVAGTRVAGPGIAGELDVAQLADGRWAVRVTVTNTGDEAIRLLRLTPLSAVPESVRLGGVPVAEWTYFRQPRHKNDMPAAVRLGDTRPGVHDALRGTPETGGPPADGLGGKPPPRFVSSEVTVLSAGAAALLLGVFPAHRQLVTCELRISEDRTRLEALDVHCECDGQRLAPGACLASQWVLVDLACSALDAMTSYAATLAGFHADPNADRASPRPPTVWCSWYYYGDAFTQAEAEENLNWLTEHPLPVDVVQFDDCWDLHWGDWEPNSDWPELRTFARRVRAAGYEPGLWTCPFLAEPRSRLARHQPQWLLRDAKGAPIRFAMGNMTNAVLDPTHPEVLEFLEAMFRRLTEEWGFTYHKLDFTRAVADPNAVFHDATKNRAEAYRLGLEAIRRGMGAKSYMNVCGGLYGPALGLANAQRTGSDVKSVWPKAPAGQESEGYGPFTIKQNTLRFWLNAVGHNDPDALMVRRRATAYRNQTLSLGLMSDEEALTSALNQYLGGGLVCFTERLAEIEADRLLLLRHCAPSQGVAALPLDAIHGPRFPSVFLTRVSPRCTALGPWVTLAFVNWTDDAREFRLGLAEVLAAAGACLPQDGREFLVTSFRRRTTQRLFAGGTLVTEAVAPHGCEVLKVQPYRTGVPLLLHTDGHFSMGGTEVRAWRPTTDGVEMVVDWPWPCPLRLAVARASAAGLADSAQVEVAGRSAGTVVSVRLQCPPT